MQYLEATTKSYSLNTCSLKLVKRCIPQCHTTMLKDFIKLTLSQFVAEIWKDNFDSFS